MSGSCISCDDSVLSTIASVAGILTFVYAVCAGFYLKTKWGANALRNSPQEFNNLVESLKQSFEEYQLFAERLTEWRDQDRILANKAARLADAAEYQLQELRSLIGIESPERLFSNRRYWWWSARFVIVQSRLKKSMEKKNEIMEELRRLQQAFTIKSQENDLLRQHQLLLDIAKRLHVVERHQQTLAAASSVPLEEPPPPMSAYTSTEDVIASLMRPRSTWPIFTDPSALSLTMENPLPPPRHSMARSRAERDFEESLRASLELTSIHTQSSTAQKPTNVVKERDENKP